MNSECTTILKIAHCVQQAHYDNGALIAHELSEEELIDVRGNLEFCLEIAQQEILERNNAR